MPCAENKFGSFKAAVICCAVSGGAPLINDHLHYAPGDACCKFVLQCLSWQYAFKVFLTLGTGPSNAHERESHNALSHIARLHTPTCTHTLKHVHSPVQLFTHILWSCDVKRYSESASAVLWVTLCSCVHSPPFHLVTVYLSACLSVTVFSHLSPQLPFSLLISCLLVFFHNASYSVNFRVHTDSTFCRCTVFIWVFRSEKESPATQAKKEKKIIWKEGWTINLSSHLKSTARFLH